MPKFSISAFNMCSFLFKSVCAYYSILIIRKNYLQYSSLALYSFERLLRKQSVFALYFLWQPLHFPLIITFDFSWSLKEEIKENYLG